MGNQPLTPQKILETAESVLRRHGPGKATVVDVAEALGVSHGLIYRHFPSKVALRDAVVERWLGRVSGALAPFSQATGAPLDDLYAWFQALRNLKVAQHRDEPELFEAYRVLTLESREVLVAHKAELERQLAVLLSRGMAAGDLAPADPLATAHALMAATSSFHHPSQASQWGKPGADESFAQLWRLLTLGLAARVSVPKE